jgi:hypothetical protein
MADKNTLSQMLESLVNGEQSKAEELFHEYVVAKSREIYEGLIESEMKDDEDEEEVDEAAEDEEAEDDKVDENFEDVAFEAGDDDEMGGDPTDDLEGELDAEMGDDEEDMGEKSEEELFMDLEAIVDELQAKFDELKGDEGQEGDDEMGDDEGGNPFAKQEDLDLATVREYVEKVPNAKMGDNGANTKSIVAGKNDMGGTTANILRGDTANDGEVGAGSKIKGSALNDQNPKEDNAGNINVPGGKAGNAFSKKEPGHGAEKKGAGESADNKQSLFRGRR